MKAFCEQLNKYGRLVSDVSYQDGSSDDGIYVADQYWENIDKILADFLPKLQGDVSFDFKLFWGYYQGIISRGLTPAFEAALKSISFCFGW